jgi:hypothetical protein
MAYTKLFQHNLHLDKMKYSSGDEPVVLNILDKNVYTLELKILEGGVAVDLTGLTLEFLEGSNTLPHSVTDAVNGVITLVFDDISSETANTTKEVILKVVNGSVERHYRGFKRSFYTLP